MPLRIVALEPSGSRRISNGNRRLLGTSRACSIATQYQPCYVAYRLRDINPLTNTPG
ncbi:hypothetical protein DA89_1963 [Vibrio paracholerae]|nr:hypothetical protein DA89_1963 [Vibrio paracholerae]KFD93603.1 hypothetical protein DN33_3348 [Vibrio cholerae]KFE25647.1 hypothetical protein DN30_3708 [Vibrio cholerae]